MNVKSIKEKMRDVPYLQTLYYQFLKRTQVVSISKPHLGGYIPGSDQATLVQPLWRHFHDELGCRTVLDVGCAEGHTIQHMIAMGYEAVGVEGLAKALERSPCPERIIIHDLTEKPYLADQPYDFVWCSEVVEHIDEAYVGNVVLTLAGNCG